MTIDNTASTVEGKKLTPGVRGEFKDRRRSANGAPSNITMSPASINSSRLFRKKARELLPLSPNTTVLQELFGQNDLLFKKRYNWKEKESGHDSIDDVKRICVFDAHQGSEVLSLINAVMRLNDLSGLKSGWKIESMLLSLPAQDRTPRQVKEWVMDNWNTKLKLV